MMQRVSQWDEVPYFDDEPGEAAYWAGHQLDVRLMENSVAAASQNTESVSVSLRMDPRLLSKIKRLARSRYLNYQSMIKQWLSERLEQEMREK